MALEITDDIDALVDVLPADIAETLREMNHFGDLLEVVLDLGRPCDARYVNREVQVTDREVRQDEIDYVVKRIGDFGDDNRAGIERTLHRISAMRNRRGRVVGLTCRVGRAVYGTIDLIQDIVESGQSLLLLGRPGVGKTTMLREVARILAEQKRVVIVDTSNEIGGDGDIPHPAVGRARRMQVATPALQHAVMIEAVENHMPEVIVIDEIGTELEAAAARTIAERGVQLVGTAHGNTLDNLMMNPTLSDLVGGIQTVTLSDEEARRRGTQKSVLERKAPPTFDVVVEIQDWDRVAVRGDVAAAVDAILRGRALPSEVRVRRPSGEIESIIEEPQRVVPGVAEREAAGGFVTEDVRAQRTQLEPLRVYPYGLNQNRIRQASRRLNLPVHLVNDLGEANVLFTLRPYYRQRPQIIAEAERRGIPVYVLRNNTVTQMETYLAQIFGLDRDPDQDRINIAMEEAQRAIETIASGERGSVQLSPQAGYVRRMQHELARQARLLSRSSGNDPRRSVTIYSDR
ncbi:MAG TPA: AAA family ATPase [Chloroflexi bacterium]|jgi:stage III sporulation protein SpoIIIAA|nr:AAA family ATPase [Chloroflexota bacterium]